MTERKPGKRQSKENQQGTQSRAPERERRILFSEVTFAALTGEAGGVHLVVPGGNRGYTSGMYGEDGRERAVRDLAEGGYVLDLRPLADNPLIFKWVVQAPMSNGRIEGNEIDRLPDDARKAAGEMASSPFGLQGAFRDLALFAAAGIGEPQDGSSGSFDHVSAAYRAAWWGVKGALIGRRMGNTLHWSDGREQMIESKLDTQDTTLPAPAKPARRSRQGTKG